MQLWGYTHLVESKPPVDTAVLAPLSGGGCPFCVLRSQQLLWSCCFSWHNLWQLVPLLAEILSHDFPMVSHLFSGS